MRPTATIRRVHAPLIHFLGKRPPPTHAHEPAPHPAAPKDVASQFSDFLRKLSSAPQGQQQPAKKQSSSTAQEWWQAPRRLVQNAVPVTDAEMDAVISGGASTLRR